MKLGAVLGISLLFAAAAVRPIDLDEEAASGGSIEPRASSDRVPSDLEESSSFIETSATGSSNSTGGCEDAAKFLLTKAWSKYAVSAEMHIKITLQLFATDLRKMAAKSQRMAPYKALSEALAVKHRSWARAVEALAGADLPGDTSLQRRALFRAMAAMEKPLQELCLAFSSGKLPATMYHNPKIQFLFTEYYEQQPDSPPPPPGRCIAHDVGAYLAEVQTYISRFPLQQLQTLVDRCLLRTDQEEAAKQRAILDNMEAAISGVRTLDLGEAFERVVYPMQQ